MELTSGMQRFVTYFGELGPRWGLAAETCRLHALLYLSAMPMNAAEVAQTLSLTADQADIAIADLVQWRMATPRGDDGWCTSGEPWDLLFAALEERRRREMRPALEQLQQCQGEMTTDGRTPAIAIERTTRLLGLIEDIAALDLQARRLSPRTLSRVLSIGGSLTRFIDRISPPSQNGRSHE
jgi:Predicted transcriptional regulators